MSTQTDDPVREVEQEVTAAFADRVVGVLDDASLCLLLSVGHQTGLLDSLAGRPPATSDTVAAAAGLHERYVREWLAGATVARVVEHDPGTQTYWLPPEHAACLTTGAGPDNLARTMQLIPLLAGVEQEIVSCFADGGGIGYDSFPRFHALMAEESAATHDAGLLDLVVPLVPGLQERLRSGVAVADIGCGAGHAVNLLARAFPASRFVGYDLAPEAIREARREAADWGLTNTEFGVRDVADLSATEEYDVITAFDAVHDQARPGRVLAGVAEALVPGGLFLMVDIKASSRVHDNIAAPGSAFFYTVSLMHCMTVSLSQDGEGLGAMWGHQTALRMLAEAGLVGARVLEVDTDPFNSYYVATRPGRPS